MKYMKCNKVYFTPPKRAFQKVVMRYNYYYYVIVIGNQITCKFFLGEPYTQSSFSKTHTRNHFLKTINPMQQFSLKFVATDFPKI